YENSSLRGIFAAGLAISTQAPTISAHRSPLRMERLRLAWIVEMRVSINVTVEHIRSLGMLLNDKMPRLTEPFSGPGEHFLQYLGPLDSKNKYLQPAVRELPFVREEF